MGISLRKIFYIAHLFNKDGGIFLKINYEDIVKNTQIRTYIEESDKTLSELGFTEHSFKHVTRVSEVAGYILTNLGYDKHEIELAKIAGYMHDMGNVINRIDHAQSGAIMAFRILDNMKVEPKDIATIITAIGNHDEKTAFPVNAVTAALIIADKTDVRSSRVRNNDKASFDQHDRVNFAVKESKVKVVDKHHIELRIKLDKKMCSMMDYFEIFIDRMILCRKAAEKLGVEFRLIINKERVI